MSSFVKRVDIAEIRKNKHLKPEIVKPKTLKPEMLKLKLLFKLSLSLLLILLISLTSMTWARSNISGDLGINIFGLPSDAPAAVIVVQLNGDFSYVIEGSGKFTDLALGEYVVAAVPVNIRGVEYEVVRQAARRITVGANTDQATEIVYQRAGTTAPVVGPVVSPPPTGVVTLQPNPTTPTNPTNPTLPATPTPVTVLPFPELPTLQPSQPIVQLPVQLPVQPPVQQPQVPTAPVIPVSNPTITGSATVSLGQGTNSLEGMVFHDQNNNGINDPIENPIAGMQVFLDLNQNRVKDSNEPLAITNEAGFYRFEGLGNRRYRVMQSLPFSWSNTVAAQQSVGITAGGQRPPEIINGSFATFEDYPFITALALRNEVNTSRGKFVQGQTWCGASLIAGNWVMTAAHCVYNTSDPNVSTPFDFSLTNQNLSIFIGGNQIRDVTVDVSKMIDVVNIIVHPQYDPFSLNNDIALLQLARPVYYSRALLPDPTVANTVYRTNTLATVLGWGDTVANDGSNFGPPPKPSEFLQKAQVPLWEQRDCVMLYPGLITSTKVCAGYVQGGIDACQGDSGGPLVVPNQNSWYQVGIVSTGYGCAQPNNPGIYTRVSEYIDWIFQNAAPEVSQQVDVDFTRSSGAARVDFGNFR